MPTTGEVASGRIFINYRRGDSQGAAGRLYDRLLLHFDRDQLFIDVDAIEPGVDFVKSLDDNVANCAAFITVIGPGWMQSKLDDPNDYVRIEIEAALKRDIRVIPVLVDGATMPAPAALPPTLQSLARRNAVEIAHHRFGADCDELARSIKSAIGLGNTPVAATDQRASAPSLPQEAGTRMPWPEVMFSFRGRIGRMQFLVGLLVVLAILLAVYMTIYITVQVIFQADDAAAQVKQQLNQFEKVLGSILEIVVWWPSFALVLKRLHDLGQGWKALLVFIALDVGSTVLDLAGQDTISTSMTWFSWGLMFMLAAIEGTPGLNKYGPPPLRKPAARA